MKIEPTEGTMHRRGWLRSASLGLLGTSWARSGFAGFQEPSEHGPGPGLEPIKIEDVDEAEIERRLLAAGLGEPRRLRSNHFLAIGDAAESFMRASLTDCEELTLAYLRHFQDRGFEVRLSERPLIVVAFRDDRSFGKFHKLPSLMRGGAQPVGMYDRSTNLLSVFDWRNVPMASRASSKNVQTVAHEGTHQLTYNTGLLDREADVPACVAEGLGTYGEPRKTLGPSDLGRMNVQRADDLAKLRRSFAWIPARELIADDMVIRAGQYGRVMLAYAESWALIHLLLNDPARTPGFREYLKSLRAGGKPGDRLAPATEHLGDLAELDRDLKAHAVRLVRAL